MTVSAPGIGVSATVGERVPDFVMSGKFRLQLVGSDTQTTFVVGDGSSDEVVFDFPWLSIAGDRVTAFRMTKRQQWDEARSYLDLRMRYSSPELGGSFDVSSPVSISSWLDTLPDPRPGQGGLLMQGAANDQVRIDVIGAGGSGKEIRANVDFGGDGTVDTSGEARWTDAGLVSGYFFADYSPGGLGNTFARDHGCNAGNLPRHDRLLRDAEPPESEADFLPDARVPEPGARHPGWHTPAARRCAASDVPLGTIGGSAGGDFDTRCRPDRCLTRPEQRHWGGPAVGQLVIAGNGDRLAIRYSDTAGPAGQYANWSVQLRSGDGTALRPGTYTDAWSASAVGLPAGANQLEFTLRCRGQTAQMISK